MDRKRDKIPRRIFDALNMWKNMEFDQEQLYMEGDIIRMDIMMKDMNNEIVDIDPEIYREHKRTEISNNNCHE